MIHYVLPVLWMTSRLTVMGATPKRGGCTMSGVAECDVYECLFVVVGIVITLGGGTCFFR